MSAQRYEKAYLWVFISAIILCWSPSNLLAYLAPLISVAIFVFLTKSQVVIRNVIIWFLAWGVIISIYTVLKPEFLIHSALLSVLTYSSFVVVLAIPGRFVASLNLLDRMLTWARWIVIIQALLGITQGLYGFSKNLSFDGANGDFVEGTIHPALAAEYSFSNSMFAINIAFLLIALLPDLILRRKGYVAVILGGIALIMASVVHVLFMLAIAGTLAVIFFWPISLRRRMTYLVGVSLIILAMIAAFALEKNFSTASGFARQLLSGESYRSIAIRRAVLEMPRTYEYLPLIGLGPGQFSSRAGLIGTGMYFGSTRNPRILPLMPTGRTQAFNYYTLDLWLQIEALEASGFSVGSTHKPWLSWLSVYTEWGILALIAILCFVFYLLLRVKVVSYSYPQRILASSFGTGLLLVLLLGLQENYWEVPQAILVGLLILKVQYAVLLNPETRNELI